MTDRFYNLSRETALEISVRYHRIETAKKDLERAEERLAYERAMYQMTFMEICHRYGFDPTEWIYGRRQDDGGMLQHVSTLKADDVRRVEWDKTSKAKSTRNSSENEEEEEEESVPGTNIGAHSNMDGDVTELLDEKTHDNHGS